MKKEKTNMEKIWSTIEKMEKEEVAKKSKVENSVKNAFDKIIGYDAIKKELMQTLDIVKNTEKYAKLGVKMPRGLLLYGEPGLGKTLMAQCFIESSARKCFQLRKEKADGNFMEAVSAVFKEAVDNQPSIVFLDDMDKFANGDEKHKDSEEYVSVQTWIDNVKDKDVFVIATANSTKKLPNSLLRSGRFDVQIFVTYPQINETKEIISYYLKSKHHIEDVDFDLIARILNGHSCADLENVINQAGMYAGFDGSDKITTDHIIKSCMRVIFDAPESMERFSEDVRKRIAYHEAGHAVISEVLEPNTVNIVSICKHLGDIGGVTSFNNADDYFHVMKYMEHRVISLLGGKAATEIAYGEIDVGANSDLHRAFDVVARMVDNYCGYGFDTFERFNSSGNLLSRKETAISAKMTEYYQMAKKILVDNKKFLDALATALFEKETLTYNEIQKIKNNL